MAAVTLLEEELQSNMATSDEDGDFEEDDEVDVNMVSENANAFAANNQLLNGVSLGQAEEEEDEEDEEDDEEEEEEDEEEEEGEEGEEEEGEDEEEEESEEGEELSDEDAEGEEDEEVAQASVAVAGETQDEDGEDEDDDEDEESEEDEDEEGEGVGAVKIKPGVADEDEDAASVQDDGEESDESDDEESKQSSDAESDVEAEWEAAAEEDEAVEPVDPNRCIFCHQDEEHDPSEDFEEYMSCAVCGDHSHRQCARDADSLKSDADAEKWRCPDCVANALAPEVAMADAGASLAVRRSSAPKLARDLLPSQRGAIRPDSHSVFNHLIVDDDPMDGSRLLRKRKTSSAEAEDHFVSPFRKRRKNNSSGSNAVTSEGDIGANEDGKHADRANGVEDSDKGLAISVRPSRSLRIKVPEQPHASIIKNSRNSLVLSFHVDSGEVQNILDRTPKPKKKRARSVGASSTIVSSYTIHSYSQPFYSLHDKENDELRSKPYGGILKEGEADTTITLPQPSDRRRFDDARQKAEEDWKVKTAAAQAEAENVKKPRKISGPASQIECINFGGFEIDTWYAAPYPEEYSRNRVLFICEFCLKYMNSEYVAWRHKMKCQAKHPPGDEIYRDGSVGVFEVDGRKNPVYCQNLCLLAKLFLGSKTLYYDVEPFLFYVMTETDELGCHFVGYFSKEKRPSSQNNVSCILTLPIHQRKGYGNLLIDFSYLLTRVEKKSGSPEKPLSDMGLVSYRNYWRLVLCYQLRNQKDQFSVIDISERTGMTADDIVSALEGLRALVRDPVTGVYALRLDYDFFEEYIQKWENKKYVKLNEKALVWTPYIMGRNNQNVMEHGPPLNAIAPRDGDEDETKSEAVLPPPLVNGDSQITVNGQANGDGTHQTDSPEAASESTPVDSEANTKVEEQMSDNALSNGLGKGNSETNGTTQTSDYSFSPTRASPSLSAARVSTSAPSQTNGFPPPGSTFSTTSASSIPPTRFEVYPPVPGHRSINRPRPGISRPKPRPSLTGSIATPRPSANRRRSGGSTRRSTGMRPSSAVRKRTGGTGRGPGRWPKGTKKSDFGNADSGPGLPPRLLKQQQQQRSKLATEVSIGSDEEEEEDEINAEVDEDAILYETPSPKRRRDRGKKVTEVEDDSMDGDEDLVVGDVDVDAEGENE